jgi:5-methylcytosine-specific restriction endonuclease McrA
MRDINRLIHMDQKDKTRLKSAIRKVWRWSAERREAIKRNKGACDLCEKPFAKKDLSVDHREPVVTSEGFTDWHSYIERMFCGSSNYDLLCAACHKVKTKSERDARVVHKRAAKKRL